MIVDLISRHAYFAKQYYSVRMNNEMFLSEIFTEEIIVR